MGTDASVQVKRVGRAALAKIVQASVPKTVAPLSSFTVAPDFEIRIGTAACASVGARYRFTRPGRGKGRPVVPVTGGRTWTQVRAPAGPQTTPKSCRISVSCKNSRRSAGGG